MSLEITFVKIETVILDYKTSSKRLEPDMYGRMEKDLSNDKINLELLTPKGIIACTGNISGSDKLDLITVLNGDSNTIMSETRCFDKSYNESVGFREMPDKGINVDAVQVEIEGITVSIKTIKKNDTGDVLAVVKEFHRPISEELYKEKKEYYEDK